uniref:Uncharacterized protein n=1 Tax=Siphoviridae sp. ctZHD14 TaxID=2827891 RepID=A0A8S5SWF5_9CAUD|nr:MAG TPA: hypothetical protein [Siphoviridae sp. ctZHD14]
MTLRACCASHNWTTYIAKRVNIPFTSHGVGTTYDQPTPLYYAVLALL